MPGQLLDTYVKTIDSSVSTDRKQEIRRSSFMVTGNWGRFMFQLTWEETKECTLPTTCEFSRFLHTSRSS
jgi:hypothetical protein